MGAMSAACRVLYFLCLLCLSIVRAQWDEGMDPREEEYFAARMREPHQGHGGDMWQQPQQGRAAGLLPKIGGLLAGIFLDKQWGRKAERKEIREYQAKFAATDNLAIKWKQAEITKADLQLEQLEILIQDAELKIAELQDAAKDAGLDLAEVQANVDHVEFKQPDRDGDGKITRKEFQAYIKEYLKTYPHLTPKDMPKFEDFDKDKNGNVTFLEWQAYLERQRREEERQLLEEQRGGRRY